MIWVLIDFMNVIIKWYLKNKKITHLVTDNNLKTSSTKKSFQKNKININIKSIELEFI